MAREKTQGRESVVATELQEHKGKELDPGFRRDDEVGGFRRDDEVESFRRNDEKIKTYSAASPK